MDNEKLYNVYQCAWNPPLPCIAKNVPKEVAERLEKKHDAIKIEVELDNKLYGEELSKSE